MYDVSGAGYDNSDDPDEVTCSPVGARTLADRELLEAQIDADFAQLVRAEGTLGGYLETAAAQQSTGTSVALLLARWRTWRPAANDQMASDAIHGSLIAGIRALTIYIGGAAGLVLDPGPPTYHSAAALLTPGPPPLGRIPPAC